MELIEVRKIWDKPRHNAFTDLIRFNGTWFGKFREGKNHLARETVLAMAMFAFYEASGDVLRNRAKHRSVVAV